MEVVYIGRNHEILGDVGELLVFGRSDHVNFTKNACLFDCVGRPCACIDIGCFFIEKVKRHHAELEACAASEEKDMVSFRNIEKFFCQSDSLIDYRLKFLASVGNLKNRETHIGEVDDSIGCLLNRVR